MVLEVGGVEHEPWNDKVKRIVILSCADILLSIFLIFYSGYRLLKYHEREYSEEILLTTNDTEISSTNMIVEIVQRRDDDNEEEIEFEPVTIGFLVLYWIILFSFLSLRLVTAFLLLSATTDMTTDPESMLRKISWWKWMCKLCLCTLAIDLLVIFYNYSTSEYVEIKLFRASLDIGEIPFRLYGIYFAGKFMKELHILFDSPMVHYNSQPSLLSSPVPGIRRSFRIFEYF